MSISCKVLLTYQHIIMNQAVYLFFAVLVLFQLYATIYADDEIVIANADKQLAAGTAKQLGSSGVEFGLYTRHNPSTRQLINVGNVSSISSSNFDNNRPTRLFIHGFTNHHGESDDVAIRHAWLKGEDLNVITIDWDSLQSFSNKPAVTTRTAGDIIAEFLNFLQKSGGLNPATTQLAGHGLGAHVISYAARVANGNYSAVIGLDPTGGDFESDADAVAVGIQPGDASHVQVIYASGGGMGLSRAAGDSAFFVNYGKEQPRCIFDIVRICAHPRATLVFAESITNPAGFPTNEDPRIYMGGRVLSTEARGTYTVATASNPPFALG